MIYDFIEIGTCDSWYTLISSADNLTRGISVEPMKIYLDRLPLKALVTKVNAALVDDETIENIDTYYITEEDINKYDLGGGLKGCNRVGRPHDLHTTFPGKLGVQAWHDNPDRSTLQTRNLVEEGLVKRSVVPCLTFKKLVEKFDVEYVKQIKIDTEGMDCQLMNSILNYYEQHPDAKMPKRFQFESNAHNKREDVDFVCDRLEKFGYTFEQRTYNDDCVAVK